MKKLREKLRGLWAKRPSFLHKKPTPSYRAGKRADLAHLAELHRADEHIAVVFRNGVGFQVEAQVEQAFH